MFAKLQATADKVKGKIDEKKEEYKEKKQAQWVAEVTDPNTKLFQNFQAWQARYEPVKEAKANKDDSDPNVVQRKMMEKLAVNIRGNIMKTLTETISKLLGPVEQAVQGKDADIAAFVNAANGIVLTYRFQYKSAKKFAYLRALGADKIAQALVNAVKKEAARNGGNVDVPEIDPAIVKQTIESITARVESEIALRQQAALDSLKSSPLFAVSGVRGEQVDAGVVMLQDFVRSYVEGQIGLVVKVMSEVVTRLLQIAAKYKSVIEKEVAAQAKGVEATSAEYEKVRAEILQEIETYYNRLEGEVGKYVNSLVNLLMGLSAEPEAPAAEE